MTKKAAAVGSDDLVWVHAANITKAKENADGTVTVIGEALTPDKLDKDQQILDPDWVKTELASWYRDWGNVREMHDPKRAVGVAQGLDITKANPVLSSLIVDPVAVQKVKTGVLKAYSVGIRGPRIMTDGAAKAGRIVGGKIVEMSLVDNPAQYVEKFVIAKRAKDTDELAAEDGAKAVDEDQAKALLAELDKADGPGGNPSLVVTTAPAGAGADPSTSPQPPQGGDSPNRIDTPAPKTADNPSTTVTPPQGGQQPSTTVTGAAGAAGAPPTDPRNLADARANFRKAVLAKVPNVSEADLNELMAAFDTILPPDLKAGGVEGESANTTAVKPDGTTDADAGLKPSGASGQQDPAPTDDPSGAGIRRAAPTELAGSLDRAAPLPELVKAVSTDETFRSSLADLLVKAVTPDLVKAAVEKALDASEAFQGVRTRLEKIEKAPAPWGPFVAGADKRFPANDVVSLETATASLTEAQKSVLVKRALLEERTHHSDPQVRMAAAEALAALPEVEITQGAPTNG